MKILKINIVYTYKSTKFINLVNIFNILFILTILVKVFKVLIRKVINFSALFFNRRYQISIAIKISTHILIIST